MRTGVTSRVSVVTVLTILIVAGTAVSVGLAAPVSRTARNRSVQSAEPLTANWNETFGRSGNDKFKAGVPTDNGGYLLVGQTNTAGGETDGWLVAVDDSGSRQFETTFGGDGADRFSDVVATGDGYLLAGWRTTDQGASQGWLLKVDDRGVEQWSKTVGGPKWDGFWKLTETADGNYTAVGRSHVDPWAVTVDGDGDLLWNRTYDVGASNSTFGAVTPTDDGLLLAGWTNYANDTERGMAIRVNESGGEQWTRTYNPNTRIWTAETTDDGFLLAGETRTDGPSRGWARVVGDDGTVSAEWTDETPGSRFIDAIPTDEGYLLVGGADQSPRGYDAVAMRFDPGLERQWVATTGGPQWDLAFSGIDTGDGYLLCGATTSGGAGGEDGWLVKLDSGNESSA